MNLMGSAVLRCFDSLRVVFVVAGIKSSSDLMDEVAAVVMKNPPEILAETCLKTGFCFSQQNLPALVALTFSANAR